MARVPPAVKGRPFGAFASLTFDSGSSPCRIWFLRAGGGKSARPKRKKLSVLTPVVFSHIHPVVSYFLLHHLEGFFISHLRC